MNLENLWVANSIGHLGANRLVDLLQQCVGAIAKFIFGNKPSRGSYKKKHYHKPWFNDDCHITK